MKHTYNINIITGEGLKEAIKAVDEYKKWLTDKTKEFVQKLADKGVEVASISFANATYSGTNDVSVSVEEKGDLSRAVVATGEATLFIEFGTGITYPDGHPERPADVAGRGQYGKWGNKPEGWRYRDYHGQGNGDAVPDPKHPGYYKTKGNPSSMSMYNAKKELEEEFANIAKEVFK